MPEQGVNLAYFVLGSNIDAAEQLPAAAGALKTRPAYLMKQPFEKRAAAVRRTLARVTANAVSEEMLAAYFLECRKELLGEWLDTLDIPHEDGILKEDAPDEPDSAKLDGAVREFCARDDDPDRKLLLQAFAAQSAVDWPALDALVPPGD